MNRRIISYLVLSLLLLGLLAGTGLAQGPATQSALGTAFTYQGQLRQSGSPVNGTCDFQFRLWDAALGGSQVESTLTKPALAVSRGLFAAALDFGTGAFKGDARWLEVSVRCPAGSGSFTALAPRQPLTAAPYALALPGFWTQPNDHSPIIIGGHSDNSATSEGATISGGGRSGAEANAVTNNYGTVGGGYGNVVSGDSATIGGGKGNNASGAGSIIGGGAGNSTGAEGATVGGGISNAADGVRSAVGGGDSNTANGNYAAIAGGYSNTASNSYATVAGGDWNTASGNFSTVGGGFENQATAERSTVAGGRGNTAVAYSSTVGGGQGNDATGTRATISGGQDNEASGPYSAIPGGMLNTAQGFYSFAAGRRAKANSDGCFVWGDSTDADATCSSTNQFVARASGGVYLYSNSAMTTGVFLATGASSWTPIPSPSDRNLKENFTPVDAREVLARLANIPISAWNYKAQDDSVRHVGPMAQDFYAAFGLGENDVTISTIDADGVALAAIQGLYEMVQQKDAQIATQQRQIDDLEARLAVLEALVAQSVGGGK
jgi:hypothetical protein